MLSIVMRVRNDFTEKIYWRAFRENDTFYTVGLREGSVEPGHTDEWRDDSFPRIKVEIKTGSVLWPKQVLAPAGTRFRMTDSLVVARNGTLDVAKFVNMTGSRVPVQRTDLQFFDARNFNEDTVRAITFSLENAFSMSEGFRESQEHSQTWSVGGKVGGEIGKKRPGGEISMGVQDEVSTFLESTFREQVTNVWRQSVTDTFTFKPGRIYAIEVTWLVALQEGVVSYFGEQTSYSVVASAHGSLTTPAAFESVEAMPAHLAERFRSFRPQ